MQRLRLFINFFFFGNFFYGLCAVSLSIEAAVQQGFQLNDCAYYLCLFLATIIYYTTAYLEVNSNVSSPNQRINWYAKNYQWLIKLHYLFIVIVAGWVGWFAFTYWKALYILTFYELILLATFPITGLMYYGVSSKFFQGFNLRRVGWIKPFIIGFTWAGLVTVYPFLYHAMVDGSHYFPTVFGGLLFIKNFMFISVLCILFDIKDYASDYNQELKTFVVKVGLRNTIYLILVPLIILGYATFIAYGFAHQFSFFRIILNSLPFILLLVVAESMKRRRSIFYYLFLIDGLMVVKAVCGIIAALYF